MKLEGLDRHQRLLDSYRKLHKARTKTAQAAASVKQLSAV
jgi:ribosomal protein S12 methylthiotransferase accessory factor